MAAHFLLSAKARTLSLASIFRMSDDEAHATFTAIRFADNGGAAFCPRCQCTAVYAYAARRIWKCKDCRHQFSVTSGTIFASRKLAIRDYLAATAIFVNAAKGISALQLGRDLDVQYKTAFVLAHKLREAISAEQIAGTLSGVVEVDGAYVGGHVRQENQKADRKDRRLASEQTGKRQSVVVARERGAGGRTLPFVVAKEADAVALIRERIAVGSIVHADEAGGWDMLHAFYDVKRINHSVAFSLDGACTNQAESYFSRLRRAGPAPPRQRQVPCRLRLRDGLAGGQPPDAERGAAPGRDGGGAGASGVAGMEGILAAWEGLAKLCLRR